MCGLVRVREHVHRTGDPCEGDGKYRRIGMDFKERISWFLY